MKITESNNELIWSDKPLFLQLFGLVFAAIGLLFPLIGVLQFLKSNEFGLKTAAILCGMGIFFMLMGILAFWSFKNTEIKVNRLLRQVIYKHGKVMRKFAVSEIDKIEYVEGYDSDSEVVFTPMMRTKNGEHLLVYRSAVRSAEMDSNIAKFNNFLGKM